MFKKIVSTLLIFSMIYVDMAWSGNMPSSGIPDSDETSERRRSHVFQDDQETCKEDSVQSLLTSEQAAATADEDMDIPSLVAVDFDATALKDEKSPLSVSGNKKVEERVSVFEEPTEAIKGGPQSEVVVPIKVAVVPHKKPDQRIPESIDAKVEQIESSRALEKKPGEEKVVIEIISIGESNSESVEHAENGKADLSNLLALQNAEKAVQEGEIERDSIAEEANALLPAALNEEQPAENNPQDLNPPVSLEMPDSRRAYSVNFVEKAQPLVVNQGEEEESFSESFYLTTLDEDLNLSAKAEAALRYIKTNIIDGELNWKQVLGVVLSMGLGGGMGLFTAQIFSKQVFQNASTILDVDNDLISNLIPFMLFIFSTIAIDTAYRTSFFVVNSLEDGASTFVMQKLPKHRASLLVATICLYFGAFVAGLLPAYYLYTVMCSDFFELECTPGNPHSSELLTGLGIGSAILILDTTIHYGQQLSGHAKHWIDTYFLKHVYINALEERRLEILSLFKDLQKLVYGLGAKKVAELYHNAFLNDKKRDEGIDEEVFIPKEGLRILRVFHAFYQGHYHLLQPDEYKDLRKKTASRMGWIGALLASPGRHIVFYGAVEEVLEGIVKIPDDFRIPLAIILGGIVAGIVQGWIEKDAIEKATYDMLGGRKTHETSSYGLLRRVLMAFDSSMGIVSTLPYILAGLVMTGRQVLKGKFGFDWSYWARVAVLVPFGFANVLNDAKAFDDSNLGLLDATNSLLGCCYASQGYKKDRLIRVLHKLRKLFHDMDPAVFEEIDRKIQSGLRQINREEDPLSTELWRSFLKRNTDYEQRRKTDIDMKGFVHDVFQERESWVEDI